MKVVEVKNVEGINKTFCKVKKVICDQCFRDLCVGETYLSVNYYKERYEHEWGDLKYMHFCSDCMKDAMYEMFMDNYYTNFDKCEHIDNQEWFQCEEINFDDYGYIVEDSNE